MISEIFEQLELLGIKGEYAISGVKAVERVDNLFFQDFTNSINTYSRWKSSEILDKFEQRGGRIVAALIKHNS